MAALEGDLVRLDAAAAGGELVDEVQLLAGSARATRVVEDTDPPGSGPAGDELQRRHADCRWRRRRRARRKRPSAPERPAGRSPRGQSVRMPPVITASGSGAVRDGLPAELRARARPVDEPDGWPPQAQRPVAGGGAPSLAGPGQSVTLAEEAARLRRTCTRAGCLSRRRDARPPATERCTCRSWCRPRRATRTRNRPPLAGRTGPKQAACGPAAPASPALLQRGLARTPGARATPPTSPAWPGRGTRCPRRPASNSPAAAHRRPARSPDSPS